MAETRTRSGALWSAHTADLAALGLGNGGRITITSDNASIVAIAQGDPAVRPGVVSMAVAWGGLPGDGADPAEQGASTNMLISTDRDVDPLNAMPRMSAIPVNIAALVDEAQDARVAAHGVA